jgi:fucose permease
MATLLLIIIYIAFISLGLPDSLLGVSWPIIQSEIGVPLSFAGIVSMLITLGTVVSSLFSSRAIQKFGTGKVTLVSVMLTAAALVGFSAAPSFVWFLVAAIPLGIGGGAVDSGLNEFIAEHYESRHMSWLHCFWGIGALTGPLIMSSIITSDNSWRLGYETVSIIQAILVGILFFSLPLWKKISGKHSRISEVTIKNQDLSQPQDQKHKSFLYPLKIKGVKLASITFFFYGGVEYVMGLWGSTFLIRIKEIDPASAAVWISAYYGSITLGRFITGFITIKMGNRQLIRVGQLIVLSGIVLIFLPLPSFMTLAAIILIGLGCAPIFPCMLHETPVRFGREDAQSVMGFQMAASYIGVTILPPLFGFIAASTTLKLFPVFLFIFGIGMLLASEGIPIKYDTNEA